MLHPIPAKPITVQVPDKLYRRLTQRAQQTRRTVEDELLDAAIGGFPLNDELPPDLEDEIQHLAVLSNEVLVRVAGSHLPPDRASKLEQIHRTAQMRALSATERALELELTREYERAMLLRARAVRLLADRGFDVSPTVAPPA